MKPEPQITETQWSKLLSRVAAIERRLTALERGSASAAPPENQRPAAASPAAASPTAAAPAADTSAATSPAATAPGRESGGRGLAELLPIVGRTVLIIGGAFVLRAITEAGILGLGAGAAAGIAYAVVWIVLAHRTVTAGRRLDATLYGIAATVIAFPLLWETTVSFEALSASAAAVALVAITAFALAVCWRDRLHGLAWVVTVAGGTTAIALAVATRRLPLFFTALLLVGLVTLWTGWSRDWRGLAGTIAIPANAGVLLMTMIAVRVDPETAAELFDPLTLVSVQMALVAVYVGSLVVRTLTRHGDLGTGDLALGVVATVVGLGGAMVVVRSTGVAAAALGAVALAMAIGGYAASFTLIDRRQAGRTNFVFYSTLALACTLVGFEALLGGVALTLALAALAIVSAWAGSHWERSTLSGHGAIYAAAMAGVSGVLGVAVAAFSSTPTAPAAIAWTVWIALPVIVGCSAFRMATHGRTWGRLSGFPKLTFITVALLGVAGVAISLVAPLVLTGSSPSGDAAVLAVLRTGALAGAAVLLAALGARERYREAGWLVYPMLVITAIKVIVEDFRVGTPATLVLSLALFGGALILAPRIASRGAAREGRAPAA